MIQMQSNKKRLKWNSEYPEKYFTDTIPIPENNKSTGA
jgi:hypothetical protein